MSEWKHIDHLSLLLKHSKLTNISQPDGGVSQETINQIADSMDTHVSVGCKRSTFIDPQSLTPESIIKSNNYTILPKHNKFSD